VLNVPLQPAAASDAARDAWQALAAAERGDELCHAWLAVLAQALLSTRAALLLLRQADGSFAPVAARPPARDLSYLAEIATEALRQRRGTVRRDELGHCRLAYPLLAGEDLHGAVVLDLGPAGPDDEQRALQLTHWGAGWMIELLQREGAARAATQGDAGRGRRLLDHLLAALQEGSLREAGMALVNRLGREFDCPQVQLALARRKTLRVLAISHAAWFDERMEAVHRAVQAMHEAWDQRLVLHWPVDAEDPARLTQAQRRYAEASGAKALLTLPLATAEQVVGVLMLERERPFAPEEVELLETLALALAPVLALRQDAERGAAGRLLQRLQRSGRWLGGSTHPGVKLGLLAGALVLAALALVPVPHRLSAPALVEGAVQRAAVAPFDGFLREAPARPGDTVQAGQVLAVLDDRDLQLERVRWESELELALRKEREAMAAGQRVEQRLAAAQANQARAQLDLALGRLARVQVTAPFDGVVVKGDLTQMLGSPLEQGRVLFELAPLDAWRVVLKVDERDIARVQTGGAGELVLSSLPGRRWPVTVTKLTPVSVAEDGRNHFRVEAELQTGEGPPPPLSPNMEGVAKLDAGRATLLWIWTHRLTDWLRLAWWRVMP
jgi:multidrug efflux pump subunit AcrA (membrane-fusion protein)